MAANGDAKTPTRLTVKEDCSLARRVKSNGSDLKRSKKKILDFVEHMIAR